MNRQSDYGYSVSPLENRTRKLCLHRAKVCDDLAEKAPDQEKFKLYRAWAHQWRLEAQTAHTGE
jgi:hypothetical protein